MFEEKIIFCSRDIKVSVFLWNLRFQNLWRHHKHWYFFWILSTIKIKFGQILVYFVANICNMFLTQSRRMKTNSRPSYDFNEVIILQDLSIFSNGNLLFSILPYSPFQKNETLETWHNWLLNNWSRFLNLKGPGT